LDAYIVLQRTPEMLVKGGWASIIGHETRHETRVRSSHGQRAGRRNRRHVRDGGLRPAWAVRDPDWQPRIWVGGGRFYRDPPKWAKPSDFDGQWNYCRGFYDQNRYEDGGQGWRTDYPGADNNFSVRLAELTLIRVKITPTASPTTSSSASTTRCSSMSHALHGRRRHDAAERRRDQGAAQLPAEGRLPYVDDFWGTEAWDQWAEEIGRVLPPAVSDLRHPRRPRDHAHACTT
jgi:hypothetical protein